MHGCEGFLLMGGREWTEKAETQTLKSLVLSGCYSKMGPQVLHGCTPTHTPIHTREGAQEEHS